MRKIKLSVVLMVLVCILGWSTLAKATILTNDNISFTELDALIGLEVTGTGNPLVSTFDFFPDNSTTGGDGIVTSQVFQGIGDAAGKNVYLYQIEHFSTSSETGINGISFSFLDFDLVNGMSSFFVGLGGIGDATSDLAAFTNGSVATSGAEWGGMLNLFGTIDFSFASLAAGSTSFIFGAIADANRLTVDANIEDDGSALIDPVSVLAAGTITPPGGTGTNPVPEPSTMALLGIGLAGLVGGYLRKKIKKEQEGAGQRRVK